VRLFTPGPVIVRFLLMMICPLVNVMVDPGLKEKVIVLPGTALEMTLRKEPAPLSAVVVTTLGGSTACAVKPTNSHTKVRKKNKIRRGETTG
jgi:hypothetical protein